MCEGNDVWSGGMLGVIGESTSRDTGSHAGSDFASGNELKRRNLANQMLHAKFQIWLDSVPGALSDLKIVTVRSICFVLFFLSFFSTSRVFSGFPMNQAFSSEPPEGGESDLQSQLVLNLLLIQHRLGDVQAQHALTS